MSTLKSKSRLPWHMLPTILALAWPTMLEQLMHTAVQYIDTAMVGSLGTEAMAAVGSTTTVNWMVGITISAVGVGFLAFISQAIGKGEEALAKRAAAQAVLVSLVIGSIFTVICLSLAPIVPTLMQVDEPIRETAAQYFFILYTPILARAVTIIFGTVLRAAGDTKTPMRVAILVNLVNVVLNFFLIYETRTVNLFGVDTWIFGAGLGVIGAAIASAIAFVVGAVLIVIALYKHPRLSPRGESMKPDGEILRSCFKVAAPNALQGFATSLGYVVFAAMVNSLGDSSTAAHTIANTVESLFYIPAYGMQTAAATLAGNAYGAKDPKTLRDLSVMALLLEVFMMVASGAALFFSARLMVGLFSTDEAVISLAVTVLCMVAVSEPFYGFSIIVEGMMQGMGRTVLPFITNVIGMWAVRIVGTFIATNFFSGTLVSAWGFMICHNLMLFVVYLTLFITGLWNPMRKQREK